VIGLGRGRLGGFLRGRRLLPAARMAHLRIQADQLAKDLEDHRRRGEGRLAAAAREVVQAELLDHEPQVLRLDDQLGVDQRALGAQIHRLQHLTAQELEREVDVAVRPAEEEADQRIVEIGVDRPPQPLGRAVEPVAGDHVGAGDFQRADRRADDVGIERQVGVHVDHQVLAGRREAGLERAAELPVHLVAQHADPRILRREEADDRRRTVRRGVVDDDDLVVAAVQLQRGDATRDGMFDVVLLVEHRNHERDRQRSDFQVRHVHPSGSFSLCSQELDRQMPAVRPQPCFSRYERHRRCE